MDSGSGKSVEEKEEQSGVINDTTDLVCSSLDSGIPILLTAMRVPLSLLQEAIGYEPVRLRQSLYGARCNDYYAF